MTFEFSNHSWVVRVDHRTVLIDPCTGNGRKGRGPHFDGLDTPYLQRLRDLGTPAEDIDTVFCTHLHHDHCGWNTMESNGHWVPTFRNAVYLFGNQEIQRWDSSNPVPHPNTFNPSVFDECVRPILESGQARIISLPYQASSSLTVLSAPGHTIGHAMLRLASEGETAYFTGDAFHHPAQLTRPELHLPGCDDLDQAVATRKVLAQCVLDERAFVFPAHFPPPHHGRLTLDGSEVSFLPGGAEEVQPPPERRAD